MHIAKYNDTPSQVSLAVGRRPGIFLFKSVAIFQLKKKKRGRIAGYNRVISPYVRFSLCPEPNTPNARSQHTTSKQQPVALESDPYIQKTTHRSLDVSSGLGKYLIFHTIGGDNLICLTLKETALGAVTKPPQNLREALQINSHVHVSCV